MMYRIALTLGLAALLHAQDFRAIVSGRVSDSSGAAVAGVRVTTTNIETGVASASMSNENGRPSFRRSTTARIARSGSSTMKGPAKECRGRT